MPSHKADYTDKEPNWVDWDGSPLTKQQWYDEIPDRQRKYRTLWERGYLVAKSITITASPNHSYHLSINNIKEGTYGEPNPLLSFEKVDATKADEAVEDSKKARYTDAPDQLSDADRDLFDELSNSITDKQTRKDYKSETGSSGINLLMLLAEEMAEANDDLAAWAATQRAQLVHRGIDSPTIIAFNSFREAYETFTRQMGERGEEDMVTAKIYVDAVRLLGDSIQTKLDLRLEIKPPKGDLAKTVTLIKKVIAKHETSNTKTSARGHTRSATDRPSGGRSGERSGDAEKSRFHDSKGNRIFVAGVDDDCTVCNGRFDRGKHLRIHCPDYVKKPTDDKPKEKEKRKGQARVAGGDGDTAAGDDYYDGNDGVDIASTSDLALSELFAGGTQTATVKRGAAKAAKPATPVPPPQPDELSVSSDESDDSTDDDERDTPVVAPKGAAVRPTPRQPSTPSYLPHPEARRRVDALTPTSPMKDIIAVKTDTGLDVSHATGGRNTQSPGISRNRYHIVSEMRHSVGLPPLPVPLGTAIGDSPPAPATEPSVAVGLATTGVPPAVPSVAAIPHLPADMSPMLEFVAVRHHADGAGGLVHAYTFRDGITEIRASCPSSGPRAVLCAPLGALLLGTSGDTTYWIATETGSLVSTTRITVSAAPSDAGAAKAAETAAVIGAPAPSSFALHVAVALLAVVATLLLVVVVTATPVIGGHASLPSPFPDPGAHDLLHGALHAGHAMSLRALAALLARLLLAGYTVAAAGAHAGSCCVCLLYCKAAADVSAAALAARVLLATVATPVGAAAAACAAAAIVAASLTAAACAVALALRLLSRACRHRCTGGWHWLSATLPGRLKRNTGRVFPQIPPTGHHPRREPRLLRPDRLLLRPQWHSRFALLRESCHSDLVGRPQGPVKLCLALQLLIVSCLDACAFRLNLRTTAAGHPAEAPTISESLEPATVLLSGAWTNCRSAAASSRQSALLLSLIAVTTAVRLATAALAAGADSELWHQRGCAATDALDTLAGSITPRWCWQAILTILDSPAAATRLASSAKRCAIHLGYVILFAFAVTFLRVRHMTLRALRSGRLILTIALVSGELAGWRHESPTQPQTRPIAAVAPLPSGVRGRLSPAVSSAIATLQRQSACDPPVLWPSVSFVPEDPSRRDAAPVGPHAACHARSMPQTPPEPGASPPPRRIGFALRKSGLQPKTHLPEAKGAWRSTHSIHRWARLVIDSGCTWHVHNKLDELFNVRDCHDVVVDANGNEVECAKMGDLLVVVRDSRKREFRVWLRGVRYSPSFEDTLISVDQLWFASRIDSVFRDVRSLVCLQNVDSASGEPLQLPFSRDDGLFRWTVGIVSGSDAQRTTPPPAGGVRALKSGIHSAGSRSHVHALPADDAAAVLHRRLHVSLDHLRRLGDHSADAPEHIAAARQLTCPICAEANSTRLPHGHSQYQPTHAGRLVHADIVGPFVSSFFGGYKYALVLVDDHTRFKFVYFLKAKSEAPEKVRSFIASMNAHASSKSPAPVRIVGSLHTDNAGEFLSRKFTELLDTELVAQTTCPPHVHALNGVAERAISSILTLTRSYLTAGNVAPSHWTHAVEMAVDVLNRTSGPAADGASGPTSYELLTGDKPRVMGIMPFGCRAFAVKPRDQYSKTTIDPRAWVGVNLGRSSRSPGAYKIYVPSAGRVVITSDAYFMEGLFPMRPRGEQHDELTDHPTVPEAVPEPQPPGPPARLAGSARQNMASVFHEAVRDGPVPSRRVLILFSGPYDRPDGIAAFLKRRGLDVDLIDSGIKGGGGEHDILNDALFIELHDHIRSGHYFAIFAAPPCSTYSVARFFRGDDDDGPPIVRTRNDILGIDDVPKGHRRELHRANEVTRRTAVLLTAASRAGCDFIIENPADRGDPTLPWLFQVADHGPIWMDPHMRELKNACSVESATFAQCMFGADTQKYTTFWFTPGLSTHMRPLLNLACSHAPGAHASNAGGVQLGDGSWNSAATASYPADLNLFIAESLLALRVAQETDVPDAPTSATNPPDDTPTAPPPPRPSATPEAPPRAAPPEAVATAPPPPPDADLPEQPETPLSPTATPPSPPAGRQRRAKLPHEHFQRGGGAIHTRSRGAASQAKAGPDDPSGHDDAMRRDADGWGPKGAEGAEIDNHENNESWRYELRSRLPKGRNLVKLTWVYKVKRDGRKKARLCVQGCTQRPGVDYDQTFCAAMRGGSLRLLSAIGGRLGLRMRRWDFVAAYLQGELEPGEVTYCTPPPGYSTALVDGRVRLVPRAQGDGIERMCIVTKPVYGMAQAGRRWQRSLFPWLTGWNKGVDGAPRLQQSVFDSCVFFCHHVVSTPSGPRDEVLLVGCYVDDLFVLSSHTDEHSLYHRFTSDLSARWDVEDEGEVTDLLSVEIERADEHIVLRQSKYISKLMSTYAPEGVPDSRFGASCRLTSHPPSRTPADEDLPQRVLAAVEQSADSIDPALLKAYQSLVGALLYCAVNTRPDVAYAVGMLCRAMGKPTPELYLDALRVLYYLHHHRDIGLRYGASDLDMSGMSDSDWAVRHSTTGYVFTYAQAAISWGCKKQATIALSSCEAEIVALSESAKEAVFLADFLSELGFPARSPTQLATDNTGARDLSYNPEHHDRVKHVERRHFFIRELVEDQRVVVPFVRTHANLADFFTKPLTGKNFFRLRNEIMNVSPDDRARASLARRHARRASARSHVRFSDSSSGAPVRRVRRHARSVHPCFDAPVRRTGGCCESHVHDTSLPYSRVVAPSYHHAPIMP